MGKLFCFVLFWVGGIWINEFPSCFYIEGLMNNELAFSFNKFFVFCFGKMWISDNCQILTTIPLPKCFFFGIMYCLTLTTLFFNLWHFACLTSTFSYKSSSYKTKGWFLENWSLIAKQMSSFNNNMSCICLYVLSNNIIVKQMLLVDQGRVHV